MNKEKWVIFGIIGGVFLIIFMLFAFSCALLLVGDMGGQHWNNNHQGDNPSIGGGYDPSGRNGFGFGGWPNQGMPNIP